MSQQIGTIFTVSIDTAILASSHDPGRTQAWLFALAGVFAFVFCGGFDRFVPVLGPWPLVPCANAELETANRTAAAVNTVFNFISMLR